MLVTGHRSTVQDFSVTAKKVMSQKKQKKEAKLAEMLDRTGDFDRLRSQMLTTMKSPPLPGATGTKVGE